MRGWSCARIEPGQARREVEDDARVRSRSFPRTLACPFFLFFFFFTCITPLAIPTRLALASQEEDRIIVAEVATLKSKLPTKMTTVRSSSTSSPPRPHLLL